MNKQEIIEELKRFEGRLKKIQEHADAFYELVPGEYKDSKDKRMAGWHGHEINKYRFHISSYTNKIIKALEGEV